MYDFLIKKRRSNFTTMVRYNAIVAAQIAERNAIKFHLDFVH